MLKVWYSALTQKYLDLSLRAGAEATVRIIERPGLWMDGEALHAVVAELRAVAASTLPDGELSYGVLTGDRERLARSVITLIHDRTSGRPVAFNALAIMDVSLHGRPNDVLHMGLVMVDPSVRSQGLSWILYGLTCLVLFVRNQLRPLWLSNVTQVPAIVGMVTETFSNVFPSPRPDARLSFDHLTLARQIMLHHRHVFGVGADAVLDEQRLVIMNAYTGGSDDLKKTFERAPKHRDALFNDFCARELDYVRGDDVLQLGQINLDTAKRFLLKDVPRSSLPALLTAFVFVSLNRLVLPALYWLSADKPWGILRPRRSVSGKASP
jgi:hypothetical protein